MPRFAYSGRDRAGQPVTAELEAPSRRDALRVLAARGVQARTVEELAAGKTVARRPAENRNVRALTRRECLPFLEALYDLVHSGLSAGEAVRLLSVRIQEPRLRRLSGPLWERISEGAPLSRAMAASPEVFESSVTNLIQAGEATGSLNDTLARMIAHLTEQRELRRQLLAALAYPAFMVVVATTPEVRV